MIAERVVFPEFLLEEIVYVVVRGIIQHVDFLEHDRFFLADFIRVENGVPEDVRQEIDGHVQMVIGDLDVEGGQLLAGKGIHHPAHGIDGRGDVEGRPAPGALEQHVLDEMRHAVGLPVFMAGPALHPDSDGNGPDVVDFFRNDSNPVIEDRFSVPWHPALPSCSDGFFPACRSPGPSPSLRPLPGGCRSPC